MARKKTTRNPRNSGSIYFDQTAKLYVAQIFVGYKPNGKPKYQRIRRKSQEEAVRALKELNAAQTQGLQIVTTPHTVGKWLIDWLEDHVKPKLTPKTYRFYEQQVRNHLLPGLGKYQLKNVKPADVAKFLNAKANEVDPETGEHVLGLASVDAMRRTLRAAYGQAIAMGLVAQNPVNAATRTGYKRTEAQHLSPEQARSLLAKLQGSPIERLVWFVLSTGTRVGEATGLRWQDVDLERRVAAISVQLQRIDGKLAHRPLKTPKSRRELPLTDMAIKAIQEERSRNTLEGFTSELNVVFLNSEGRPMDPKYVDNHLKAALRAANLPEGGMHMLRHTAGTLMLMAGQGLHIVSRALGHSSITLTSDTYGHILSDPLREALGTIGDAISNDRQAEKD